MAPGKDRGAPGSHLKVPIVGKVEESCPTCAMVYKHLKTGLTFAVVRQMMMVGPDAETWRRKRRGSVLGYWRELKVTAWRYHIAECEQNAALALAAEVVPF